MKDWKRRYLAAGLHWRHGFQLSLTVGLALVLVSGPSIQLIAAAVIADGASLYSSIFGEQIMPFPTWSGWVSEGLEPPYLLCALTTVLACGLGTRAMSVILWGTLASAIGLTVIDVTKVGTDGLGVSIVCNVLGGIVIACAVLATVLVAERIRFALRRASIGRAVALLLWPLLAGLTCSFLLYVVLRILLHPTPVQVSLDADVPFNGYYSADYDLGCYSKSLRAYQPASCPRGEPAKEEGKASQARKPQQFSFMGKIKQTQKLRWIGESDPLRLKWVASSVGPMTATLRAAQGCFPSPDDAREKARTVPGISASRELEIEIARTMFHMQPLGENSISEASLEEPGLAQFSVQYSDDQEKALDAGRFVSTAKLTMHPKLSGGSIVIQMMPETQDRAGHGDGLRKITVRQDNREAHVVLKEASKISPDAPVQCLPLNIAGGAATLDSLVTSLVVDVDGPDIVSYSSMQNPSSFTVDKLNGWVDLKGVDRGDLEYFAQDGRLDVMFLNAGYSKLQFDGAEVERAKRSLVYLYGDLHASIRSSTLTVTGEAFSAHVDGQRINKTRWEKADAALRIAFLTALPGLVLFYWRRLRVFFTQSKNVWRIAHDHGVD